MIDYIELSQTTPWGEPCAQLGDESYMHNAKAEAHVYIQQLTRLLGGNPPGTIFKIVRYPHDFGTYLDIRFYFDDEDQQHVRYMQDVENGYENWDEESLRLLKTFSYNLATAKHGKR